jgi:hypothetical protein
MSQSNEEFNPGLSLADAALLDRLIEANFDPAAVETSSGDERRRLNALSAAIGLLNDYPVDDADDLLIDATLARIARHRELDRGVVARLTADDTPARRAWRMPDFMSIAAVLLICASIGWPIVGAMRQRSIDAACVANLASLGSAFASYANEFSGRVPMATAGFSGATTAASWVDPSILARLGYCDHGHAFCPGHAGEVGYSRQVIALPRPGAEFSWFTAPAGAIMGDRNPIVDAYESASLLPPPATNSRSHKGRGQNVLMHDGSVNWLQAPVVESDENIWLVRGREVYTPGDVPNEPGDVYLAH